MTLAIQLLLATVIIATVIEFTAAKDLKEIALALRQKRQNEIEEFEKNQNELLQQAQNDVALRNKRGGCGCCCCCCCCCCGCGRKKRQILTILRARRNAVADNIISEAANDFGGDYASKGFGGGHEDNTNQNQNQGNGGGDSEDCAECDEKK